MIRSIRKRALWSVLAVTFLAGGLGHGLAADASRLAQANTSSQERLPMSMSMTVGGVHRFE